mgnify:CR=1 FL=1
MISGIFRRNYYVFGLDSHFFQKKSKIAGNAVLKQRGKKGNLFILKQIQKKSKIQIKVGLIWGNDKKNPKVGFSEV